TFFAGSPCAKAISFARNFTTLLPTPAESRNSFTSKAGLFEFAFLGGGRTLWVHVELRKTWLNPNSARHGRHLMSFSSLCSPVAVDRIAARVQREATLSAFTVVCCKWNKRGIGDAANNGGLCQEKP